MRPNGYLVILLFVESSPPPQQFFRIQKIDIFLRPTAKVKRLEFGFSISTSADRGLGGGKKRVVKGKNWIREGEKGGERKSI
jgi:hypothetical protein